MNYKSKLHNMKITCRYFNHFNWVGFKWEIVTIFFSFLNDFYNVKFTISTCKWHENILKISTETIFSIKFAMMNFMNKRSFFFNSFLNDTYNLNMYIKKNILNFDM